MKENAPLFISALDTPQHIERNEPFLLHSLAIQKIASATCLRCGGKNTLFQEHCQHCQADLLRWFTCREPTCQTTQEAASFCRDCQTRLTGPLSNKTLTCDGIYYRLREWIGGGGMGEVYRAIALRKGGPPLREVAIKLNKEITQRDLCVRFEREVAALARLHSPHSVKVYGYGEHKEEGILIAQYMIMELLQGITLQKYSERGPLASEEALLIFSQIASALREAHIQGVIHRDLKPNNVMLTVDPQNKLQAKLFDFGLSKDTNKNGTELSSSGVILGTLWYMSPEQARGEDIDQRSDIFSLGVILYQLLTGQLPFPASNLFELYQLHPQGLPSLVLRMPEELQEILHGCLAYRAQDRFRTLDACLALLTQPFPSFTLKLQSSSSELPQAESPFALPLPNDQTETLLGSRTWAGSFLWLLAVLFVGSGFVAFLFYQRTQLHPTQTAFDLRLSPPARFSPPPLHNLSKPSPMLPSKKAITQKTPSKPTAETTLALQKSQTPAVRRKNTLSPSHPHPMNPSNEAAPARRKKAPTKSLKIRTLFAWPSTCLEVLLFFPKEQNQDPIPLQANHRLFPGNYRVLCQDLRVRLRKTFLITISRSPFQQKITLDLKRFRQRIFIRPWAFLYIDGFFVSGCQSACEIEMWSGKTEFLLKQCPTGFSVQRCLQQPAAQQIVFRRILQAESPITPALKLRWK